MCQRLYFLSGVYLGLHMKLETSLNTQAMIVSSVFNIITRLDKLFLCNELVQR